MAPANAATSRRGATVNGLSKSAEPPSAIAAHLAPGLSADGWRGPQHDQESLAQLLREVLGNQDGQVNLDTDVNVNHKLICVIAKAGLDISKHDDPFSSNDQVEQQTLDCLEVVDVAIRKTPEVLHHTSEPDELGQEIVNAPLFTWLLPQLLSLFGTCTEGAVRNKVFRVLSNIVVAQSHCSHAMHNCGSISQYLQTLATDVISSIEALDLIDLPDTSPDLRFPVSAHVFANSLDRLTLRDPPLGAKFTTESLPHAVKAVLCLLSIISSANVFQGSIHPQAMAVRRNALWALDCYRKIWKATARWFTSQLGQDDMSDPVVSFLKEIRLFYHNICSSKDRLCPHQQTALLWIQSAAEVVKWDRLTQEHALQAALCPVLQEIRLCSRQSPQVAGALEDILLPTLENLRANHLRIEKMSHDLRIVITRFFDKGDSGFQEQNDVNARPLHQAFEANADQTLDNGRARKRLRLSCYEEKLSAPNELQKLVKSTYRLLGSQDVADVDGLSLVAANCYQKLSPDHQCVALARLGRIACAGAGTLIRNEVRDSLLEDARCYICDSDSTRHDHRETWDTHGMDELFKTMLNLLPQLQRSAKPRIVAMLALRRLVMHDSNVEYLRLTQGTVGEWCLHSLRSSLRELRAVAGQTLTAFLEQSLGPEIYRNNRIVALEFLLTLHGKNEAQFQETCIMCLSQIAQVSGDEEMNIILVRFLEYLGHANPYISGLVYSELQKLAQHVGLTPGGLLRPFWRTLAVTLVQNLQSRPQMAQHLCDLLGLKFSQLLVLTQAYTLPYLVLNRKKDIIQKIASASGAEESVFSICTERFHLAAILAILLTQPSADPESMILSLLLELSEEFRTKDIAEWIGVEPILIACELLKAGGDAGGCEGSKIYQALHLLASFTNRRPGQTGGSSRRSDLVGIFFEGHVLGIITQFVDIINDVQIRQPNIEKRRCLRGIGEMIKMGKSRICSALPQICACLRSAIEIEELSDQAFAAWSILITTLGQEDIEPLIDQTLSIIVRSWNMFQPESQEGAYAVVGHIFQNHSALVRQIANTMPSLASIPVMAKFEAEMGKLKAQMDQRHRFLAFASRCQNENLIVVEQSLAELVPELEQHQEFLHQTVVNEQPDPVLAQVTRSILDCCVKFNSVSETATTLCGKCLGLIGCPDPNRVESVKETRDMLVLSNFARADETIEFILFFLQHIVVQAFLSASNTKAQGFLAWAMQNLLKICDLDSTATLRSREIHANANYRRWLDLPEVVRNMLTPFLTSRYTVSLGGFNSTCTYPLFSPKLSHGEWLRKFVLDLLQKDSGDNVQLIFTICSRIIRWQDISIAAFLLPFAALNLTISGTDLQRHELMQEMLSILSHPLPGADRQSSQTVRLCSENVFQILDYLSRWLQEKKKQLSAARGSTIQSHRPAPDAALDVNLAQLQSVEQVLAYIPAEVISRRAVECKSFARALFHWEQFIRQERSKTGPTDHDSKLEPLFERLQDIYTQIDEPDGIEGISAHLHVLNIDQQVLEHRKAGRWIAAQSWYELLLNERPEDTEVQVNLLTCLKESGQHNALLKQFDGLEASGATLPKVLPFAVEACWVTAKWNMLDKYLKMSSGAVTGDFNVGMGLAFKALHGGDHEEFSKIVYDLQHMLARGLTTTSTKSLKACHDTMLKLHVLTEVESIARPNSNGSNERSKLLQTLERRLDVLGGLLSDKQYVLGLRRAAMQLSSTFSDLDVASAWLTGAKLARKEDSTNQAFNAVLHATQLGDKSATIEHARLLWKEGHHQKAIQTLEGAIEADSFITYDFVSEASLPSTVPGRQSEQNILTSRAHLLLAKWLDQAGQTQSEEIVKRYRQGINFYRKSEKGFYYLGKHYNKILDSEKAKPPEKQDQRYLSGEAAKLVIENYLRSLLFGSKYVFHILPKVLTLWLELASEVDQPPDPRRGNSERFQAHNVAQKKKVVETIHGQVKKYTDRMNPSLLYTILPQVVARICHQNPTVYDILTEIVTKTVSAYPQQALWTLLAVAKSSSKDRATRGLLCLRKLSEHGKKMKSNSTAADLTSMANQGQKLADELLRVCEVDIQGKPSKISLVRDLSFNHKLAPCRLVVPLESTLTASLPITIDGAGVKGFRAFSRDTVTISTFLDEVLVLASLQKPRKINIRGSDGKVYGLLCKPKDDLRKDQRLMEFNSMINRFLKRDIESSKRRLYIKTYAVTPLNEECGLIEWVDNLKTFRDILLKLYKERNIVPNYGDIRSWLDQACSDESKLPVFTEKVNSTFPPVFHEWFVEIFPEPRAWFDARLRYTRSCAVMSMVGYVLGLGDRHGENILFEEDNGGTLHVDFNCLFDKGLTFEKPEMVPFRLTHNMTDAFGAYGYNGPFRRSCELSLGLLRQNEDALMTILETFLYDPTTDFIGKKKRHANVPDTPQGVLDSVRNKLRGLLPGESVPLSVGGHVDELIMQATSVKNLAAMYIGWCAFF